MRAILLDVLRVTLAVAIPLASFTTGLGAPVGDAGSLWRRPARLGRALFAVLVAVPLWALLVLELLPLDRPARAGILVAVLSVGLGPVAGMNRLRVESPTARRALELNIAVLAASVVFVPLAFFGLAALFHHEVTLGWGAVARVVLLRALLPCLAGLAVARLRPLAAERMERPLAKMVNAVALLILVAALLATGKVLAAVPPVVWLACVAIAGGALAIGRLWAGDDRALRPALATAAVMRFPALALVLASATGQRPLLMPSVLAFLLIALAAEGLYRTIDKRRARRAASPGGGRPGRLAGSTATAAG
jgi:predicted Na+-dependent transporter